MLALLIIYSHLACHLPPALSETSVSCKHLFGDRSAFIDVLHCLCSTLIVVRRHTSTLLKGRVPLSLLL